MRLTNVQIAIIIALAATSGGRLLAQGDQSSAKLWQEIDQLAPRKAGLVPVPMPSAAIDWVERISKSEEIMVRAFRSVLAKSVEHRVNMRVAAFMVAIERVVKVITLRGVYA